MDDQTAASTGHRKRPISTGRIIGFGILLVVIVLLASCVYRVAAPLATPNVFGLDRKITSLPCVTWVSSDPRGGKIAVRGPLVKYRIGVSPGCTASEVENILWTMREGVGDTGAYLEDWTLFVAQTEEARYSAFSDDLEIGRLSGEGSLSREQIQHLASSWVTLHELDPMSQLDSRREYSEDTREYELQMAVSLNMTPENLEKITSIIPTELNSKTTHWRITTPTTGTVSEKANDFSPGRLLLDTYGQVPDQGLIALGVAASKTWQGDTPDGTYVTVTSKPWDPQGRVNQTVSVEVYNVSDAQLSPWEKDILQNTLPPIEQTGVWPHLASMIDRLDATGQPFSLGLELSSEEAEPYSMRQGAGSDISGHLTSKQCHVAPKAHEVWNTIDQPLYGYWLNPQRPRTPKSSASKYCPAGASAGAEGS